MIEEGSTGNNKIDTGNDQEEIYKLASCLGPTKLKKILTELEHLEEEKVSESWFTLDNLNIFLSHNNSNKIIYVFLFSRESLEWSQKYRSTSIYTSSYIKHHTVQCKVSQSVGQSVSQAVGHSIVSSPPARINSRKSQSPKA